MGKLTLDSDLWTKLNGLNEPLELCDEAGQTVGHFLPSPLYEDLFYTALAAESPHSKEELKRSIGNPAGGLWRKFGNASSLLSFFFQVCPIQ